MYLVENMGLSCFLSNLIGPQFLLNILGSKVKREKKKKGKRRTGSIALQTEAESIPLRASEASKHKKSEKSHSKLLVKLGSPAKSHPAKMFLSRVS